jgi:hypothetical protein
LAIDLNVNNQKESVMNSIPTMLQYVMAQQNRQTLSPEELALLQASSGEPVSGGYVGYDNIAANDKPSLLQRLFGNKPQPTQTPAEAAKPAEGLFEPGSIGDQIRRRREEADKATRDVSMLPEDMLYAANDTGTRTDAYGGVSSQTRAGLAQLGAEDPNGDLGDMAIGKPAAAAPGGYAAKTTTRGAQTSKQEDQLIKMLMGRGMSESEARARAKSIK